MRGSALEGTTTCTCRTPPEQNSSTRCWTAANACSAELLRYLACTVSLSRLTHLASNSSVTIKMYCRGSTLNHQYNQMLRYHARRVGSGTTESIRATRGSTTQDGTDAIHGCCVVLFLFSWLDTKRLSGRAVIISLVSMRSVCAVSLSVIRCVLRVLRSPEHTITTNALYVSDSVGNVLSTNRKRNLALNSARAQQTFEAKVTVCRHVVSQQTFVSGLDHCRGIMSTRERRGAGEREEKTRWKEKKEEKRDSFKLDVP